MPRRCRGIRGDVGIAPYGMTTLRGVWADRVVRPYALFSTPLVS